MLELQEHSFASYRHLPLCTMPATGLNEANTGLQICSNLRVLSAHACHNFERLVRQLTRQTDDPIGISDDVVTRAHPHDLSIIAEFQIFINCSDFHNVIGRCGTQALCKDLTSED